MLSLRLALPEAQKEKVLLDQIAAGLVDPPKHWFNADEWMAFQFEKFQQRHGQ